MRHFESYKREEAASFIEKQAVVGLTQPQKMIVKGFNLFFNRNLKAFNSKEAAVAFLVGDQ